MSRLDFLDLHFKTKELCFDENEFLQTDFSLNKFLKKHNRAIFDTLRDDLGSYLKSLRHSTIELINKDYEDFLNLSTDLIGLDKAINSIESPLNQLREEVILVKLSLEETMIGLKSCLEEHKKLRERKRSLQHLSQVNRSLSDLKIILTTSNNDAVSLDHIERAAVEFSQLQYSMSKCTSDKTSVFKNEIESISQAMVSVLNNRFLEYLCERQVDELGRCLRIYAGLDHIKTLEQFVSDEVVSPALQTFFKLKVFDLKVVLDKVLDFIDTQLFDLLTLTSYTSKEPSVKGYNFIVNSLWPVLENKLEYYSDTIFAPGDPDKFHIKYCQSIDFLTKLEERCGDVEAVSNLRLHPLYLQFMQKWNLQIYFKIRFRQISSTLEQGLDELHLAQNGACNEEPGFQLTSSTYVMKCLNMCWQDNIYIQQLSHMFWKLSLQIVSRYGNWLSQFIAEENTKLQKGEVKPAVPNLDFLVCLFTDITILIKEIPNVLASASSKITNNEAINSLLNRSIKLSITELEDCLPKLSNCIVNIVVKDCLECIKQVSAIPRYFRRTNRELPTEPSSYVQNIFLTPRQFHESKINVVPVDVLNKWLTSIFSIINEQLYNTISDVLINIQKTEESLRNLKKIRNKGLKDNDFKTGISDDHKIREQLLLDVKEFDRGIRSFNLIVNTSSLIELVENAVASNNKL